MTVFLLVLAAILILILVLFLYAKKAAVNFTGRDDNLTVDEETCPENFRAYIHQYNEAMKTVSKLAYEPLSIVSKDGLHLSGKLYRMHRDNHKLVIGFHGYHGSDLYDMARFFLLYNSLGYDIMVISERTHHDSEGTYITFGSHEQEDGLLWIQKAVELYSGDVQIVIHGVSMGAATVDLISGNEQLPPQVKCAVSDCAYTSLEQQARAMFKIPQWILTVFLSMMNFWMKKLADFDLNDAAPIKAVVHAQVPILFIHGEEDRFVPISMLEPLYESCSSEKEKFTVPKAGHASSYAVDPVGYGEKFTEFVQKYVKDIKDTK